MTETPLGFIHSGVKLFLNHKLVDGMHASLLHCVLSKGSTQSKKPTVSLSFLSLRDNCIVPTKRVRDTLLSSLENQEKLTENQK